MQVKLGSQLQPGDMIQMESGNIVPLDNVSPTADTDAILVKWSEPCWGHVSPDKEYSVYSQSELESGLTSDPWQKGKAPLLRESANVPQSFGAALKSRRAQSR